MITRPTTQQVILGIVRDLNEVVLPTVADEPARVAIGMISQLLSGCATRAAHEIAWMHDEIAAMDAATGHSTTVVSLHLDDVCTAYHDASVALSEAIETAYAAGDTERAASLRELLLARSGHEMEIVGALDLVGRG
jgi:hypothetical protein